MTLTSVRARHATTANDKGVAGSGRFARSADVLLLGLWFALLTGVIEAGRVIVLRGLLDRFTWLPLDTVWMAPVANAYYFAGPVILASLAVFLLPGRVHVWMATFPFALISSFSLMMLFGRHRVSHWALAVLAVGVSLQITRLAARSWPVFRRVVRSGVVVMIAATLVLLGGTVALRAQSRRFVPSDAVKAGEGSLNVLLIILDTVRSASLSLYGYMRPTTPQLERWARGGVVFDQAFATAPWTLTSHGSMFTGRWPHELSTDWERPLDGTYPTLAEILQRRGYQTAAFVGNLKYTADDSGLKRGFNEYQSYKRSWEQLLRSSALGQTLRAWQNGSNPVYPPPAPKRAPEINAEFAEWLSTRRDRTRPFFVFLNYYDAHLPYRSTRAFREKFKHSDGRIGGYDAAIANLDYEIDGLLRDLERRGTLKNTLVVITSDHGELLGEHGLTEHGNSLYVPVLQVPLVMWAPRGVPRNMRVQQPVTLRDLPRTILDLSGGGNDLPGQSLASAWGAAPANVSPILSMVSKGIRTPPEWPVTKGGLTSILGGGWHYIRNDDGTEELYSTAADPAESRNVKNAPSARADLERLRAELARLLASPTTNESKTK